MKCARITKRFQKHSSAYTRYKLVRFFQSDHASLYPATSVMCKDWAPQYGNLAE